MFDYSRFPPSSRYHPVERVTLDDLGDTGRRALDAEMDRLLGPFRCPVYAEGRCDGTRKTVCGACGARGHGNCARWGHHPVDLVTCCDARPSYSVSLAAAEALLLRMRALGWDCALFWDHAGAAQVTFLPAGDAAQHALALDSGEHDGVLDPWHSGDMTARDPCLARAICLAVLAALNAFPWLRQHASAHRDWGRHPGLS